MKKLGNPKFFCYLCNRNSIVYESDIDPGDCQGTL